MVDNDSTGYKAQEWIVLFDGRIKHSEKFIHHQAFIDGLEEDADNQKAK